MNGPLGAGGAQAVYDAWLALIPTFFNQFGVGVPAGDKGDGAASTGAAGAADRNAGAAITNDPLQAIARAYEPMLKAADPSNWLAPWSAAMPFSSPASGNAGDSGTAPSAAPKMVDPWTTMFAPFLGAPLGAGTGSGAGAAAAADPAALFSSGMASMLGPWMAALPLNPGAGASSKGLGLAGAAAAMQPFQQAQQAWLEVVTRLGGGSPQSYVTAFDRTFGGVFDALGFGPMRKLQTALQDLAAASLAQNDSRAAYGVLLQGAFVSGFEQLMTQLANLADAGKHIDSVLALLRLWAVSTEQAVHEVLQSERGLAATAALTRTGVAYRRKTQSVASIVADALDIATRRDLDDAYREIHNLKRELRASRPAAPLAPAAPPKRRARTRKKDST